MICVRALLKGIKLKHVMIKEPYRNIRRNWRKVGEERYVKNKIDKLIRVIKLRRDALIGCNLNCKYFNMITDKLIPKITGCGIIKLIELIYSKILKQSFLHSNGLSAFELIYDKILLIPPEEIGFHPSELFYVFRLANVTFDVIVKKIYWLYRNVKDIKVALLNKNIIIYRNDQVLQNYLHYYSKNYEPIKYFKVIN